MAREKTAKQLLAEAVVQEEDSSWACICPVTSGCGTTDDEGNHHPFASAGWPTKAIARARLDEHLDDHRGTPASSLEEFRAKHGLAQHSDGRRAVRIEDL